MIFDNATQLQTDINIRPLIFKAWLSRKYFFFWLEILYNVPQ